MGRAAQTGLEPSHRKTLKYIGCREGMLILELIRWYQRASVSCRRPWAKGEVYSTNGVKPGPQSL